MPRSKTIRFALHVIGIAVSSGIAFAIWTVSTAIAWSPIIARSDDSERSYEKLPLFIRFCVHIPEVMGYPFSWIRPHGIWDGPQEFVLIWMFWGIIIYLLAYGLNRTRHKTI